MKQLQNNFTTPEQSKRLMEWGVPADSADGVYELKQIGTKFIMSKTPDIIPQTMRLSWTINSRIPCWSVGRLIEIYFICSFQPGILIYYTVEDLVDYLLGLFEGVAMDFSKLED